MPIFLIGYMCSGKTTLGAALARALHYDFIDLDEYIETLTGKSVKEIFSTDGEKAFRRLEQEALHAVSTRENCIVACGGGTPCQEGAMEQMNASGVTVYLHPNMERLLCRLMDGRSKRPLIAHIDSVAEMQEFAQKAIAKRLPYYKKSVHEFDSSYLENEQEINASVDQFIKEIITQNHK